MIVVYKALYCLFVYSTIIQAKVIFIKPTLYFIALTSMKQNKALRVEVVWIITIFLK